MTTETTILEIVRDFSPIEVECTFNIFSPSEAGSGEQFRFVEAVNTKTNQEIVLTWDEIAEARSQLCE